MNLLKSGPKLGQQTVYIWVAHKPTVLLFNVITTTQFSGKKMECRGVCSLWPDEIEDLWQVLLYTLNQSQLSHLIAPIQFSASEDPHFFLSSIMPSKQAQVLRMVLQNNSIGLCYFCEDFRLPGGSRVGEP